MVESVNKDLFQEFGHQKEQDQEWLDKDNF